MGTEASLSLTSVDVHQYLSYWPDQNSNSHLSLEFEEDGLALEDQMIDIQAEPEPQASHDHMPPPGPADADCRSLDLSTLYVPGMFHIIDNATKDVLKRSVVWSDPVKIMLESVLLFFNAFHRRKWFVAKCCVGPFGAWAVFFESAAPKLEGGRAWGVVSEGVAWVLERKVMLRQAWDADALLAAGAAPVPDGAGDRDAQQQQESTKLVTRVDEALRSSLFWAFLGMCSCVTDILNSITSWAQGCACHGREVRLQLRPLLRGKDRLSCPMRGRRAPEVAEGALHRFIDGLFHFNDSQILLVRSAGLDEEIKMRLILDWSAMKVHMRVQFDLKLSPWRQLPLSALALGHWDVSVAQRLMWECMGEWEHLDAEQQSAAHPRSKELFLAISERKC